MLRTAAWLGRRWSSAGVRRSINWVHSDAATSAAGRPQTRYPHAACPCSAATAAPIITGTAHAARGRPNRREYTAGRGRPLGWSVLRKTAATGTFSVGTERPDPASSRLKYERPAPNGRASRVRRGQLFFSRRVRDLGDHRSVSGLRPGNCCVLCFVRLVPGIAEVRGRVKVLLDGPWRHPL